MVVYSQSLQILFELMLKLYLKLYLKDTPVSGYTVQSTGLGLMSLTSVVILSRKIILARLSEHTESRNTHTHVFFALMTSQQTLLRTWRIS